MRRENYFERPTDEHISVGHLSARTGRCPLWGCSSITAEQRTLNPQVVGPSPTTPIIHKRSTR